MKAKIEELRQRKKKTARKKYMSQAIAIHLANGNPNSPLVKSYWNTYHCIESINFDEEGHTHTHHCKNRWCLACNAIRTAKLIRGYSPALKAMKNPYFVTLTLPNCEPTVDALRETMDFMYKTFRDVTQSKVCRKMKFQMLRKFECTISEKYGNFHPHFHVIIDGEEEAKELLNGWLKRVPSANDNAQNIRKADVGSMIELFKYFTKIFTKTEDNKRHLPDAQKLDAIFCAISGRRTFQPYGQIKLIHEDFEDYELTEELKELASKVFFWNEYDWVDEVSGEVLTGYVPSEELQQITEQAKGIKKKTPPE